MVIVIVRWYIKAGQDEAFKTTWINEMVPRIKTGLFREFFSKPVDSVNEKYHTFDMESLHYTTYVNVGIWESVGSFDSAIGALIPNREKHCDPKKVNKELVEVFDFEFKLRERIVMTVEEDRNGDWALPPPSL